MPILLQILAKKTRSNLQTISFQDTWFQMGELDMPPEPLRWLVTSRLKPHTLKYFKPLYTRLPTGTHYVPIFSNNFSLENLQNFPMTIVQGRFKYAITCSAAYKKEGEIVEKLCTAVLDDVYNLSDRRKQLGLQEQVRR